MYLELSLLFWVVLELENFEQSPAICSKRFSDIKINFISCVFI